MGQVFEPYNYIRNIKDDKNYEYIDNNLNIGGTYISSPANTSMANLYDDRVKDLEEAKADYDEVYIAYKDEVTRAETLLEENKLLKEEIERLNEQLRKAKKDKECTRQDQLAVEDTINLTC